MDPEVEQLSQLVGARVREHRLALAWTLDALAERAGVSRRMLVSIEQGGVNPSIGTLLRLGGALGVGLPTLVDAPRAVPIAVTRSGEGAALWTGEHGGRAVLVAGAETPDVLELWDWALHPGERRASEPHAPGTRELLQVRSGVLEVTVGDRSVRLDAGDAVAFGGDVDHAYANRGERPATFSLAVLEPARGERREREDGGA